MNKPLSHHPFGAIIVPPYETDGYGWAMAQAQLIRERRLELIDWDNVAEEIEGMGKSELRAVVSALRIVLLHRLKWQHQPLYCSRSWANSIAEHLRRFDEDMAANPSLKSRLDDILRDAYRQARYEAAQETGRLPDVFPEAPPAWDEIRAPLNL
jgi:hypothetical protein